QHIPHYFCRTNPYSHTLSSMLACALSKKPFVYTHNHKQDKNPHTPQKKSLPTKVMLFLKRLLSLIIAAHQKYNLLSNDNDFHHLQTLEPSRLNILDIILHGESPSHLTILIDDE